MGDTWKNGGLFGTGAYAYGDNDVPVWNAALGRFVPGTGGGSGDVVGPGSATNNDVVLFDGVTGKLIKDSGKTLAQVQTDAVTAAEAAILPIDLTTDVTGDLPYANLVQASAASKILVRGSASGAGDWQEGSLGSGLAMSGTTLSVTGVVSGTDPRSAIYAPFTPSGDDDEFDDNSFSGWTAVNSGSHNPTITEVNDALSILMPGSDASAELHGYVKARTVVADDWIQTCVRGQGKPQNFNMFGLVFASGATYGAGSQSVFMLSINESAFYVGLMTNWSANGGVGNISVNPVTHAPINGDLLMRLKYEGSNHYRSYLSPDGVNWLEVGTQFTVTFTPTHVGFFASTWSGTNPFCWCPRFMRFGNG